MGEQFPGWAGPRPEGAQFQFDGRSGPTLLHLCRDAMSRYIRWRTAAPRFAVVPDGGHTLFFLYDVEGLTKGWAAAPFALGLNAADHRDFPACEPHEGWMLSLYVIDADTGSVPSMHGATLMPAFSAALDGLLAAQRAALPGFTPAAHEAAIDRAHRRWPDPAAMA